MSFLDTILNVVFPTKCILCEEDGADLCLTCLRDAPSAERESAKWIFPLYDYRHLPIKKSLWLLKYKGKKRLASIFAEIIYEKILEELSELSVMENFSNIILIPVPLSPKRYWERGYNQAELICREIVRISKTRHLTPPASHSSPLQQSWRGAGGEGNINLQLENNILIKIKETEHQARIKDRRIRLKNLIGSFAIKSAEKNTSLIKNRNIILIDDITTTGATLSEARKVLKQAGARKIIAFTVAH
ncbi:MAG: phosphoribosyltransferase family protein [Candidatus Pacebacteria bacterium]|nr:phosphoribosyltransferase family protein [Candidatus Paceibacterota bacterium]